jgi:hypothetical protein
LRLSAAVAAAGVVIGLLLINARGHARRPESEADAALAAAAPAGGEVAAAQVKS